MRLTFDLPIECNDMSKGEVARIAVGIKKVVDDLNFILSNVSEENLSSALKDKLNTTSDESKEALKLANEALDAIREMKEGEANVSAVDEVLSEDTGV